jgi:hypothetical protein
MDFGTMLASAWSAGISLYGVAAVLGITGRLGWVNAPSILEEPWVIAAALILFVVELVVDKIALLDSVWDTAHLVIRPIGGAVICSTAPDATLPLPVLVLMGGVLALSSHSAKASARLMINASPEPISNVVVSFAEDGLVSALMALAIAFPKVAAVITVVLAVASGVAAVLFYRASRALWRRVGARRRRWRDRHGSPAPPASSP